MSYYNLSNEEIVFLYYASKTIKDQYEEIFDTEILEQKIPTETGVKKLKTPIPKEMMEDILKGVHYRMMKSVNEKLTPLFEMIKESDPELIADIEDAFSTKK